jgi:hypothetical protein
MRYPVGKERLNQFKPSLTNELVLGLRLLMPNYMDAARVVTEVYMRVCVFGFGMHLA